MSDDIKQMSDRELADTLEYYQANSHALQRAAEQHKGAPVYDSVLWYEILPEVRRRLRERPVGGSPPHGPYTDPRTGERLCVACGAPESEHPVIVGGHPWCGGAFRPSRPEEDENERAEDPGRD